MDKALQGIVDRHREEMERFRTMVRDLRAELNDWEREGEDLSEEEAYEAYQRIRILCDEIKTWIGAHMGIKN